MRRPAAAVSVLAWAVVVCVAAGATWAVIDGVGGNLGTADERSSAVLAVPSETGSPSKSRSKPSSSSSKSQSESPGAKPSQSTGSSPSASPSQSRTESSTGAGKPEVWHGPPGLLSVRCDGRLVRLESATPANGYGVEVEHNGTTELEAKFESSTREVRVDATCVNGNPVFTVESDEE